MTERTVILHYHLFKNAGTSIDGALKTGFPGRWASKEFPTVGGNNSPLIAEWIRGEPNGVAFSTHTGMGPIPELPNVDVFSLLFLRDPIDRIKSVYRFEREQKAETMGAKLAKSEDFEGYVRHRLGIAGDRQCRNFQSNRLAKFRPGESSELDRALASLDSLSFVGFVGDFENSLVDLAVKIRAFLPEFRVHEIPHLNRSAANAGSSDYGLRPELLELLYESNREDFEILYRAGFIRQLPS